MDQSSLVKEQIDAGEKLANEFHARYRPLKAAFWLKEHEGGRWYLYLVPDQIDDSGIRPAYAEVIDLLGPGPHIWLGSSQVKIVKVTNPVARGVIDEQAKYGKFATKLYGMVGGRAIDEAVLYPPPRLTPKVVAGTG